MSTTTDVATTSDALLADLGSALTEWYERAMDLWQITARIGAILRDAHRAVEDEQWPVWLDQAGLSPYQAFVFMKAERYPDLMREHKPGSLQAISRLLPQGQGTAYDEEQAACARRLAEGGMARNALAVHFGVSENTLQRWLEPEAWERRQERSRERKRERAEANRRAEQARLLREAKKAGGDPSAAYEYIRKASEALDRARVDADNPERRHEFEQALQAAYRVEDHLGRALGIA